MRPNAEHAITAAGGRAADDDDASRGAQTSSMAPLSTSSVKVSWLTRRERSAFPAQSNIPKSSRPNFREIAIAGDFTSS